MKFPAIRRPNSAKAVLLAGGLLIPSLLLSSCTTSQTTDAAGSATGSVEVFAAASLNAVGEELATAYRAEHPEVEIIYNFAGSSKLVAQMQEGATPDLLITADISTMEVAQETLSELADTQPEIIASNALVLATADGNPAAIDEVEDLAQSGTITALCAPEVPCGKLAQQELTESQVNPATASYEANVTEVATKLATGQADAGFIYSTDATALAKTQNITVIELPNLESNQYPLAKTATGAKNQAAEDYATWLSESPQAAQILADYGFVTP